MKKTVLIVYSIIFLTGLAQVKAQTMENNSTNKGYKIGDVAADFKLKNVDQKTVSLSDYAAAKGFIVVFTCNHCPYAKAYESRIIALDQKYASKGYPVIAINPNDLIVVPADNFEAM